MERIPRIKVEYRRLENGQIDAVCEMSINVSAATRLTEEPTSEMKAQLTDQFQLAFEEKLLDLAAAVLSQRGEGLSPIAKKLPASPELSS